MPGAGGAALWPVAVTMTVLLMTGQASRPHPSICDVQCCTAYPSCSDADSITCSCHTTDQLLLQNGSFPESVQTIYITGGQDVIIESHAISRLSHLVNLVVRELSTLEIREHGLLLQSNSKLRSLSIFAVQTVTVHDSAFSGSWHDANIQMQQITSLSVEQNAFNYHSPSQGPSLTVLSVGVFHLASNAFTAPVSRLSISYSHMNSCPLNSFGGNVHRLVLYHVTIVDAQRGCVKSDLNGMAELSILSCKLISVQTRAFSGYISDVLISDTTITSVRKNGFEIQAVTLQINGSYIDELSSNGLAVSSKNSTILGNVRIGSLKKHALIGLKVNKGSDVNDHPLVIQTLKIDEAEHASLTFAACMPVCINGLNVTRPRPQVCPTERWTRQLVGSRPGDQLTEAEYQVYQNLVRGNPCTKDEYEPRSSTGADLLCTDTFDDPQGDGSAKHPHGASGADRAGTSHAAGGTHSTYTPQGTTVFVGTDTRQGAGGPVRTDTTQGAKGDGEPDTSQGPTGPGTPHTSLSPGVGDDAYLGEPSQGRAGVGRSAEPDTTVGGGGGGGGGSDDTGRLVLYCGLGVGVPLALAAVGTAFCVLVQQRRARAATVPRPPDDTLKTRGEHPQRRHHENDVADSRPLQRRPGPAGDITACDTTPEICDYAEVPMPDDAALGDDDYAEISGSDIYAEPVAATGSGTAQYGDYAEIPPPLDAVAYSAGPESCDYAEIPSLGQREAGRPPAFVSASEKEVYTEVGESALLVPPVVPGPGESQRDSREAPPLPPVTQERLQMAYVMLENKLYVSAEEVTRPGARGVTPTAAGGCGGY